MLVLEYDLQKNWKILKKMKNKINDFFDAFYGSRELTSKFKLKKGDNIVISSQGSINGCYGFFSFQNKHNAPLISVPRTGSIGEAYVQEYNCSVDDNCIVLKPKKELEIEFLYFIATIIREEKWKFTYGRVITPDRLENVKFDLKFYDKQKIIIIRNRILKKVENFLHERSKI